MTIYSYPPRQVTVSFLAGVLPACFFFIFITDDPFYPHSGYLDPFIYIGYGLTFTDPDYYPGYYKISRLPVILLNALFHKNFDSAIAIFAMGMSMLIALATLSFTSCLRYTKNLLISAIFTVVISLHPIFIVLSGGFVSYHAYIGTIFLAAAFCFIPVSSHCPINIKNCILCFIFISLMLHSDPMGIMLFSAFFIIFCLSVSNVGAGKILHLTAIKELLKSAINTGLLFCFSFSAVTLLLCLIYKFYYGHYLFFNPYLKTALNLLSNPSKDIWYSTITLESIMAGSLNHMLGGICAISFFVLVYLPLKKYTSPQNNTGIIFSGLLLTLSLYAVSWLHGNHVMLFAHFSQGYTFYAYFCIAAMFSKLIKSERFSALKICAPTLVAASLLIYEQYFDSLNIFLISNRYVPCIIILSSLVLMSFLYYIRHKKSKSNIYSRIYGILAKLSLC